MRDQSPPGFCQIYNAKETQREQNCGSPTYQRLLRDIDRGFCLPIEVVEVLLNKPIDIQITTASNHSWKIPVRSAVFTQLQTEPHGSASSEHFAN